MKQYHYTWLLLGLSIIGSLIQATAQNSSTSTFDIIEARSNSFLANDLFELEIAISNLLYTNPYDDEQVEVEAVFTNGSREIVVDAFYYQDFRRCTDCPIPPLKYECKRDDDIADSEYLTPVETARPWRVRFSPPVAGSWTYIVRARVGDIDVSSSSRVAIFRESDIKGCIQVASDKRYFEYPDGTPYFPIGANIVRYGRTDIYNRVVYEFTTESMIQMADYSGNLARLWMCPRRFGMEWEDTGVGDYTLRQNRMHDLDMIVQLADSIDVKLLLSIDAAYQMAERWDENPYKNVLTEDQDQDDFFTSIECKKYYKRKLRYIMARWGYSASIMAFELWNEVDFYHKANYYNTYRDIRAWHEEMIAYMKTLDHAGHMYTTSTAYPTAGDFGKKKHRLMSSDAIDFNQVHYYESNMNVEHYRSYFTQRGLDIHDKPILLGEYGNALDCYHRTNNFTDLDEHRVNEMHNTLWSQSLSGGAGSGLYWWADGIFNLCWGGQYKYFEPLAKLMSYFVNAEDRRTTAISNPCQCSGPKDRSHISSHPDNTDCEPLNLTKEKVANKDHILTGIKTSYDCKLSVFALKSSEQIIGWIHNKDSYWYNLPHNADPYDSATYCEDLDDNQPTSPDAIEVIERQVALIDDVEFDGPCTIHFFSTYPTYDVDGDGVPDDGGIIPQLTLRDVSVKKGRLIFPIPKLQALGEAPFAPDYGFRVSPQR